MATPVSVLLLAADAAAAATGTRAVRAAGTSASAASDKLRFTGVHRGAGAIDSIKISPPHLFANFLAEYSPKPVPSPPTRL